MKNSSIIMVGDKSDAFSPFAVFETFKNWTSVRDVKILPQGVYFAVLVLTDYQTVDIRPDLFVQGYRPHSSGKNLSVDKRRYGEFVREKRTNFKDDVVFCQSQLYQVMGEREVALVLKNGDSHCFEKIEQLTKKICAENGYERLSDIKKYSYSCPSASGYFLACRTYHVWSVLIGKSTGFALDKKVLIFEYETGIPAIVDYDDRNFERM